MVMKTEPWGDALDSALADGYETGSHAPALIVPTPSGRSFTQELAVELSERPWLIFTPARYEGIDRRVMDEYATRMPVYEVSIGAFMTSIVIFLIGSALSGMAQNMGELIGFRAV
ncbi:hypothetical protein ABZ372_40240, partial [Streptomyces sp. NPDC005921]